MSKARNLSAFISEAAIDATEIGSNAVTTDKIIDQAVTPAKLHNTLDLSSKTVTLPTGGITGNAINGGVISNFASTGIDDNASATAVTILSDGKVGIGTPNPQAQLHLNTTRTSSTNATSFILSDNVTGAQTDGVYKSIRSTSNNGNSISEIRFVETDGTNNNTAIAFATQSTAGGLTERLRVHRDGNVGIGTSSPSYGLHVKNAVDAQAAGQFERTGGAIMRIQPEGFDAKFGTYSNTPLEFMTNSTERMRIESGGDIKIINPAASPVNGVNLPGALVFEGNGWNTAEGSRPLQGQIHLWGGYNNPTGGSVEPALVFSLKGTGNGSYSTADGPDVLTERMRLDNYGKLGIGTASPEVKLEVNGGADGSVVFGGRSDGGNGNNRRFNLIAYADGGGANYGGGLKIQTRDSVNVFHDRITVQSNGNVSISGTVYADRFINNVVQVGNVSSSSAQFDWDKHYHFQIPANNSWYTVLTNFRDVSGTMLATVSDSASGDTALYTFRVTTPPYGVSMFSNLHYVDGGWNTGGFNFRIASNGSSYNIECQYSSYYNSGNTATGKIKFTCL